MKNKAVLPIAALVAIVVVGGVFAYQFSVAPTAQPLADAMEKPEAAGEGSAMEKEQTAEGPAMAEKEGEAMMEKEGDATMEKASYTGAVIAGSDTPYIRYNKADFDKARAEGKGVYLYFYATWCPLCAAERPKILDAFGSLSVADAVGFESHWSDGQNTQEDNDLARQYGISTQHTHLFIARDGSVLVKKVGNLATGELESTLKEAAQA